MPKRAPSDAGRTAVRIQVCLLPSELVELDALAARRARPGYPANRSEAIRAALEHYLNDEADGRLDQSPRHEKTGTPVGSGSARR